MIHIIFGIPILGYIYSPLEEIPKYAPAVLFVFFPVIVLSGFFVFKNCFQIPADWKIDRKLVKNLVRGRLAELD